VIGRISNQDSYMLYDNYQHETLANEPARLALSGQWGATEREFLRLPPNGQKCPVTGLSRSYLNLLILPCGQNEFRPPVRSFVLRKRGAKTGVRLIDYSSLRKYIRAHEETSSLTAGESHGHQSGNVSMEVK
jgi:hypothetical protein